MKSIFVLLTANWLVTRLLFRVAKPSWLGMNHPIHVLAGPSGLPRDL